MACKTTTKVYPKCTYHQWCAHLGYNFLLLYFFFLGWVTNFAVISTKPYSLQNKSSNPSSSAASFAASRLGGFFKLPSLSNMP